MTVPHIIAHVFFHVVPEEALTNQRECAWLTLMTSVVMDA